MPVGVCTGEVGGVEWGVHSKERGCLSGCTWWQHRWVVGMADKSLQ